MEMQFLPPDADFCLRCTGDCMAQDGIYDGDIVFIRSQSTVENGELAAVSIDGQAYLKYFYETDGKITLMTADPKRIPWWEFDRDQCQSMQIIGRAVGVYRALIPFAQKEKT